MSSRAEVYLEFGLTPAQYHGQLDRLWKALGATKGPNGEDVFTLAIQAIEQRRCKVSSIPGLEYLEKEGWEIVRYDFANPGEPYVGHDGTVWKWDGLGPSAAKHIIIRKIEKPKTYRAFANAAEYVANRREGFAVDWNLKDSRPGFYAVVAANSSFLWVAFGDVNQRFDWDQAFEKLMFRHVDNTTSPFGVEVTS